MITTFNKKNQKKFNDIYPSYLEFQEDLFRSTRSEEITEEEVELAKDLEDSYSIENSIETFITYDILNAKINEDTGKWTITKRTKVVTYTYDTTLSNKFGIKIPMTIEQARILFTLLFARYGDEPLLGFQDETRWKLKLMSIIYQYAPNYFARLDVQEKVRALSLTELQTGLTSIYNHAENPNADPSTQALEELDYISDQNVSKMKKSIINAYADKLALLDDNITEKFLNRFSKLFSIYLSKDEPLYIYESEE